MWLLLLEKKNVSVGCKFPPLSLSCDSQILPSLKTALVNDINSQRLYTYHVPWTILGALYLLTQIRFGRQYHSHCVVEETEAQTG